jgi:hypothetical protein
VAAGRKGAALVPGTLVVEDSPAAEGNLAAAAVEDTLAADKPAAVAAPVVPESLPIDCQVQLSPSKLCAPSEYPHSSLCLNYSVTYRRPWNPP